MSQAREAARLLREAGIDRENVKDFLAELTDVDKALLSDLWLNDLARLMDADLEEQVDELTMRLATEQVETDRLRNVLRLLEQEAASTAKSMPKFRSWVQQTARRAIDGDAL